MLSVGAGGVRGVLEGEPGYPGDLAAILKGGQSALMMAHARLRRGPAIDMGAVMLLPPIPNPGKIVCVGANYATALSEDEPLPPYPVLFARYATSLVGHQCPLIRPRVSTQLDYEGELAVVVGRRGRHIATESALDHVAGYSIFNDGSVRDYQAKSRLWTAGKNFDATGAFGPVFVTADELPAGGRDLTLETRLNGEVVQRATTSEMIFDVARLILLLSEVMTLEPGDVLVTGTPAGVGARRDPPRFMTAGDVCEVEIGRIGTLQNQVSDEDGVPT